MGWTELVRRSPYLPGHVAAARDRPVLLTEQWWAHNVFWSSVCEIFKEKRCSISILLKAVGEDPIIIVLYRRHESARSKSGRRQQLLSIRPLLIALAALARPLLHVGSLTESCWGGWRVE